MSGPGLGKLTGDPDATPRTDRALRRLGNPINVVTENGVYIDSEGRIAVRPGSATTPYREITSATTILTTDFTINVTSGTFSQPLPTAVGISGRVYAIRNSGAGAVTLDPAGAELIDGAATLVLASGVVARIQSNGTTGWITI